MVVRMRWWCAWWWDGGDGVLVLVMMMMVVLMSRWWWRLETMWMARGARGSADQVDRAMGMVFKNSPEKFSGGGATVVAGGWPVAAGYEGTRGGRSLSDCFRVSVKTEKLSGMSFYIKLL
ncbi:hypothetical protein Tco_1015813 [Tanacetum coccineum]|uniref:Uncharacterized protein n=1 Tax=Tanacetum coccineum TaxID=301880 RepID=A0ABQ5FLV6_9ASTR